MPRETRRSRPVPRIALTGGVASGKSTVAALFQRLGAQLIDTDQISRDLVQPPSALLGQLVERFGPQVLATDGSLDRSRLRQMVFQDQRARADLEALMHPAIRAETDRRSAVAGGPYQLIAVPLLAETGTQSAYDRVLVVDCDPQMQLRRLMLRDGIDAAAARRMLAAQATREARLAIADDVIRNDGTPAALAPQVEALHAVYLQMARRLSPGADKAG